MDSEIVAHAAQSRKRRRGGAMTTKQQLTAWVQANEADYLRRFANLIAQGRSPAQAVKAIRIRDELERLTTTQGLTVADAFRQIDAQRYEGGDYETS